MGVAQKPRTEITTALYYAHMRKPWSFADVAAHWDSEPGYDLLNARIDSYLRRFIDSAPLFQIPDHARILDVDCRTGNGTKFFAEKYPTATFMCFAMAASFVEQAKQRLTPMGPRAKVERFHDLPLPIPDASFDVILCYETLEHVPTPKAFVAELSRVLAPEGRIILTTPNRLWEPVHWLSAILHIDHGEGPHRMLPRGEILTILKETGLMIETERSFVLIPAGHAFLLRVGKFLESILPESILRIVALRRTFICHKIKDIWWHKLKTEIVDTELETQCGTSIGLSEGTLRYEGRGRSLILTRTEKKEPVPRAAYEASPARYCNYPALNIFVFGKLPENWLLGVTEKSYIGHATDEIIRRRSASGGVTTALLMHLLETKRIAGAVCLCMGKTKPWQAEPVVARTREEIIACAGSVYSQTPTNMILEKLTEEIGPLAYVGLPDQVAAIRKLQMMKHPSVRNIAYVVGPYMGTQMGFEAIRSFLRSHGVRSEEEITSLKYRAGEWPGHLEISLRDGRTLRAAKFHYNYLIPFFITRGSLQLVDFTNELTDISVGDAWSPKYEQAGGGHSVILARSEKGLAILLEMQEKGLLDLREIPLDEALDMHGHMLDFKKRGSFIRQRWMKTRPEYGYEPVHIPMSRVAVEQVLRCIFWLGRLASVQWAVERMPIGIVGPIFNVFRKTWKNLSKPTKRKGLRDMKMRVF